ncbi:MAG TPA: hypothetical protein P5567_01780 [Kiritimatiellia bacterium]|nr:hypothetical protein [Kiritimatiellia bacterium]HRZ11164.1 hypothetical protein [Kiritimatiellia bacterium]HSA19464.1 hypothetical protein [Kiritimatiellia bacterium]
MFGNALAWLPILLLVFLLAFTPGIGFMEDLGRHLLLGRLILDRGSVPDTNLLTYTWPDYPFINHHWLSEVVFYGLHRAVGLQRLPFWRRQVAADQLVYELYSLACVNEFPRLWPALWELHRRYPDYQVVHELLRVCAPPEAVDAVKDVMARRARWPLAAKQALDWGRVLEGEGRADEARAVYRRGRWFFPLSPDLARALAGPGR